MENNKKKSSILKDALALFIITLVSGFALSFVYEITKDPIKAQENAKKLEGYQVAFSEAEKIETDEDLTLQLENINLTDLDATYAGVTIDEINKAYDGSDQMIGYILKVSTTKGYKDVISVAIGYSLDGTVKGFEILSINETAGLGMNANQPEFKNKFSNKKVEQFVTTKTGATADNEIDIISGATITTDAIVYAVNAGIGYLQEFSTELGGGSNE